MALGGGPSLRGWDSNPRPSGYEPDELPLLYPAMGCEGNTFLTNARATTAQEGFLASALQQGIFGDTPTTSNPTECSSASTSARV